MGAGVAQVMTGVAGVDVPERLMTCVVLATLAVLSVNVIVPERDPALCGVNSTPVWQLAEAERV
jgi:hypothetical protein